MEETIEDPKFIEFFSTNYFLYDALVNADRITMNCLCSKLHISNTELINGLKKAKITTNINELYRIAKNINTHLLKMPKVYQIYQKSITQHFFLDEKCLELFIPINEYHFDFRKLISQRFEQTIAKERFKLLCRFHEHSSFTFSETIGDKTILNLQNDFVKSYYDSIPDCIKSLSDDEKFIINNELSVAFLHGIVTFPSAGISSPHLSGLFNFSSRKPGTGYLSLDSLLNKHSEIPKEKLDQILIWLKNNNHLYQDFQPLTLENYHFRINPECAPMGSSINIAIIPNETGTTDKQGNVYIRLRNKDGNLTGKFIPLEEALVLSFPILFPSGKIQKIPGKTLREKSKFILGSHPYFRCGRLACHLILFLYSIIMDHDTSFTQYGFSLQRLQIPQGTSRNIEPDSFRSDDPAFPTYWQHKQADVRAMCSQFGDPDLMITFTFVNKWTEVSDTEKRIGGIFNSNIDIRFCPYEEMEIWKNRFLDIKGKGFKDLIMGMNFGEPIHYAWRLEFQARGAPHVHALIWLKKLLDINKIDSSFFATMPSKEIDKLHSLVDGPMIHSCNIARCKKGDANANCKYGFPKKECGETHITDDGELLLKRGSSDSNIVDYSPYFLLKWQGHCHVHILKCAEHPEASPNAIFYIVKYNFKPEPSLNVQFEDISKKFDDSNNSNFRDLFHARIVSAEDAISKIFSHKHFGCDVTTKYISLKPPEERKAAFRGNRQVQITKIDQYFNRPLELERIGILSFFSLYDINAANITNHELFDELEKKSMPTVPPSRTREKNTLAIDSKWEIHNLPNPSLIERGWIFPSQMLQDAKALECVLRKNAQIVITEKYGTSSNIEELCYVYLLINGCWRSDAEMKANKNSWYDAVIFHGLIISPYDDEKTFNRLLINYMLQSPRYSSLDISRNISRMKENMLPYIDSLYNQCSNEQKKVLDEIKDVLNCRTQLELNNQIESINEPPNASIIDKYISYSFNEDKKQKASEDLNHSMVLFNDEQKTIFNTIERRIISNIQVLAFISGKAGTGKSFLIESLKNYFIINSIPFIVCASTGIAASLINGKTVHSAFGIFSNKDDGTENVYCSLDASKENGYSMYFAKFIIIDEVTMISANVLEAINQGLKRLSSQMNSTDFDKAFGGKSILLFGDLAQVPAVTNARDDYTESIAQFNQSVTFTNFNRWSLSKIMRQNPDEIQFLKLLDYIRNHNDDENMDTEIKDLLKKIFIPGKMENVIDQIDDFVGNDDPFGMVITFTNRTASEYNSLILRKRPTFDKKITFLAKFFVKNVEYHLSDRKNFNDQNEIHRHRDNSEYSIASDLDVKIFFGAIRKRYINTIIPIDLVLAPNCRIMLLQNIDISSGLINGARGTFISFNRSLDALEIKFDFQKSSDNPIFINRRKSVEYQIHEGKVIFMYQFPIKLSWAVTAHKSQGQTLSKVAVHIGESAFAHGSFYVALSRVKSLDNVILFGRSDWPENGPVFHINQYIKYAQEEQADNE